jgi:uncharacterized protein YpuA (DUF1002 family)
MELTKTYEDLEQNNNSNIVGDAEIQYDEILNLLYIKEEAIKDRHYRKMLEEKKALLKIKNILKSISIQRAYTDNRFRNQIDSIVFKIKNPSICISEGFEELKEILDSLEEIAKKEEDYEKEILDTIKSEIGNRLWDKFKVKFESNLFLNML